MHIYINTYTSTYIHICMYMYVCIYICIILLLVRYSSFRKTRHIHASCTCMHVTKESNIQRARARKAEKERDTECKGVTS